MKVRDRLKFYAEWLRDKRRLTIKLKQLKLPCAVTGE